MSTRIPCYHYYQIFINFISDEFYFTSDFPNRNSVFRIPVDYFVSSSMKVSSKSLHPFLTFRKSTSQYMEELGFKLRQLGSRMYVLNP